MAKTIIIMTDRRGNNLEAFNNLFEVVDKYGFDYFDLKKSINNLEVRGIKYKFREVNIN